MVREDPGEFVGVPGAKCRDHRVVLALGVGLGVEERDDEARVRLDHQEYAIRRGCEVRHPADARELLVEDVVLVEPVARLEIVHALHGRLEAVDVLGPGVADDAGRHLRLEQRA